LLSIKDRAHLRPTPLGGRWTWALTIVVLATILVSSPTARAATVGVDQNHGTVYYVAGTGEANSVTVSLGSGSYAISDPGATINAQTGCSLTDSHHASCAVTGVKWIYVSSADLDDVITLQAPTPAWVDCGQGSDSVTSATAMNEYLWTANCELVNAPPPVAAPPTSSPGASLPAAPPLVIQNPVATMTSAGSVPIPLSCASSAGADCTGTIIFELPPTRASGSSVTTSRRGAPNILGKKEISLARGKKKRVTVSMTSRGRGLVKRHRRLRVTARIELKQGGVVTTSTQTLTIRAPRR
jgi:hypothetical protein